MLNDKTISNLKYYANRVKSVISDMDGIGFDLEDLLADYKLLADELEQTKSELQKLQAIHDRWLPLPTGEHGEQA